MQHTAKPSEKVAVVGVIDPDANTAATYTSAWVDMGHFADIMAIIMAGDLGASATVDAKFEQATSSAGAGAKDISPARAITQLTQAGTDDNKQVVMNLRAEELDKANNFRYARLSMTVAVATSDSGAIVLGLNPKTTPNTSYDLSTVDEIVG